MRFENNNLDVSFYAIYTEYTEGYTKKNDILTQA